MTGDQQIISVTPLNRKFTGVDGAYFRVHHFARQLASPYPLLAAVGARTSRIEIGTGVIDMRYQMLRCRHVT